ncbi:hypothetical protein PAHAL_1G287900 [Panicum hallii]|uniref:Uncharacterized protein n=1 Tax=Panicum hallii TaxID=206008 RepID=A0A2T8KWN7_9POAL|nr:hypothetical protein PAHAL_1G287900 [Panicum hallii]
MDVARLMQWTRTQRSKAGSPLGSPVARACHSSLGGQKSWCCDKASARCVGIGPCPWVVSLSLCSKPWRCSCRGPMMLVKLRRLWPGELAQKATCRGRGSAITTGRASAHGPHIETLSGFPYGSSLDIDP